MVTSFLSMHEALGLILGITYTPRYLEPAPTLQGMEVQCVGDCLEPRVVEMEPEGDSDRTACRSHHVKKSFLLWLEIKPGWLWVKVGMGWLQQENYKIRLRFERGQFGS